MARNRKSQKSITPLRVGALLALLAVAGATTFWGLSPRQPEPRTPSASQTTPKRYIPKTFVNRDGALEGVLADAGDAATSGATAADGAVPAPIPVPVIDAETRAALEKSQFRGLPHREQDGPGGTEAIPSKQFLEYLKREQAAAASSPAAATRDGSATPATAAANDGASDDTASASKNATSTAKGETGYVPAPMPHTVRKAPNKIDWSQVPGAKLAHGVESYTPGQGVMQYGGSGSEGYPGEEEDGPATYGVGGSSYDMRDVGGVSYLPSVRNQGQFGTCWTFASNAAVESRLMVMNGGGAAFDFSEKHIANHQNQNKVLGSSDHYYSGAQPSYGGNYGMSSAYYLRWEGPVLESDDPYPSGTWNYNDSTPNPTVQKHVQGVWFLPEPNFTGASLEPLDDIKSAVMTYGAVGCSIRSQEIGNATYWSEANKALYYTGSGSDHTVAIVGWDDNFSSANFGNTKPAGNGAWLVRNSWGGSDSGYSSTGYFWISYYDNLVMADLMVISDIQAADNYSAIYSYTPLGRISYFQCGGYDGGTKDYMAAIYTAQSSQPIKAVGFMAETAGAAADVYTIKVYTGVTSDPTTGATLAATKSFTPASVGYHTVVLDSSVAVTQGQKFSVVVQLTNGSDGVYPIEKTYDGYCVAAASAGQTYISNNGTNWHDTTSLNWLGNAATANLLVNAYAAGSSGPEPVSADALSASLESPRTLGETIELTCTASGGSSTLMYCWHIQDPQGNWSTIKDWHSSNNAVWTPSATGTYQIACWVKESQSQEQKDDQIGLTFVIADAVQATGFSANPSGTITVGDSTTLAMSASGGASTLQYCFHAQAPGGEWSEIRGYQSGNTFVWTPNAVGRWNLAAWVKESNSSAIKDAQLGGSIYVAEAPVDATAISVTPGEPQNVGTETTISVTASGGTDLRYKYFVKAPGGDYVVLSDYSAASSVNWTPAVAGNHEIAVWVKDSDSTASSDDMIGTVFEVVNPPVDLTAISVDKEEPQAPGTALTISATATGTDLRYKFYIKNPLGEWSVLQDYSAASTAAWTPTAAGAHEIAVWVKSSISSASRDDQLGMGYDVATPPAELTGVSVSPVAPQPAGSNLTISATATGSDLRYQFYVKAPSGGYVSLGAYSDQSSIAWTPAENGLHEIAVWVKHKDSSASRDDQIGMSYDVGQSPVTLDAINTSAASSNYGNEVTITLDASGGTTAQNRRFRCWVQKPGGAWTELSAGWSASSSFNFTPGDYETGFWQIAAWAKDVDSTRTFDSQKGTSYKVTAPPVSFDSLATSPEAPVSTGATVTITASASGGGLAPEYRFYTATPAGSWTMIQDYSTDNTATFVPNSAGTWQVAVWVRDPQTGNTKDAQKGKSVVVQ